MVDKIAFNPGAVAHPSIGSREYFVDFQCGHCGNKGNGSVIGYYTDAGGVLRWVMCPTCSHGSVMDRNGITYPSPKFGVELLGLPSEIEKAYDEARNCMSVKAYSACTLICRKILMHAAVDKGDEEGKMYSEQVNWLQAVYYMTQKHHRLKMICPDCGSVFLGLVKSFKEKVECPSCD